MRGERDKRRNDVRREKGEHNNKGKRRRPMSNRPGCFDTPRRSKNAQQKNIKKLYKSTQREKEKSPFFIIVIILRGARGFSFFVKALWSSSQLLSYTG
jgi:hypothetical protein